jgi:O-acetyl-ADP-ribose deacetylase
MRFEAVRADITTLDTEAIVNAANPWMLGGGGVDGAIHKAAGPGLMRECRSLPEVQPGVRCPTGEARLTGGYELAARFIIHTVGPVWGEDEPEVSDRLLASCYASTLALAKAHEVRSIAFPCISTGLYGFPAGRAAAVAVAASRQHACAPVERVIFCCFRDRDLVLYEALLGQ